jgi:hypothetical protein
MPSSSTTALTIPHAYHALLKQALLAVKFSTPARHTILSTLRRSFRSPPLHDSTSTVNYDPTRINNTIHFLSVAALPRTLEGRVLKTLLHTWWWQDVDRGRGKLPQQAMHTLMHKAEERSRGVKTVRRRGKETMEDVDLRVQGEKGFEAMVAGLNESMGLCLPVR